MTSPSRAPLAAQYRELNARYWQGQLPPTVPRGLGFVSRAVAVYRVGMLLRNGGHGALGRFVPSTPARIQIVSLLTHEHERQVLLHEMVHCHLHFAGHRFEPGNYHDAPFVAELRRLAAAGESWATEQADAYADALRALLADRRGWASPSIYGRRS